MAHRSRGPCARPTIVCWTAHMPQVLASAPAAGRLNCCGLGNDDQLLAALNLRFRKRPVRCPHSHAYTNDVLCAEGPRSRLSQAASTLSRRPARRFCTCYADEACQVPAWGNRSVVVRHSGSLWRHTHVCLHATWCLTRNACFA